VFRFILYLTSTGAVPQITLEVLEPLPQIRFQE